MSHNNDDDLNQIDPGQYDELDDQQFDDQPLDEVGDDFGSEGDAWSDTQEGDDFSMSDDAEGGQPQKKKSFPVAYVLIGLVVVGALGFGYMKFSGGTAHVPSPEQAGAAADGTPLQAGSSLSALRDEPGDQYKPTPAEGLPEPEPTRAQGGFMNPPQPDEAFPDKAPETAEEPAPQEAATPPVPQTPEEAPSTPPALPQDGPALTAVEETAATPPDATLAAPETPPAAPADPGAALLPDIKATSDFPSVDQIKKAETKGEAAAPPSLTGDPVQPEPSPEPAPAPSLAETPPPTPAPEPTPPVDTAKTAELEEKLSAAQSRIEALEAELKDVKEEAEKAAARPFETQSAPAAERPVPVKRVTKSVKSSAPKSVTASAPVVRRSWELRSAQPGQAMISSRDGQGDIRTVSVGDTVPGLGRIVAITKTGSGWIVRGTSGSVSQ